MRYKTHNLRRNLAMSILGAFAQLQKASAPACARLRPPAPACARLHGQLGSHCTDFHEIQYWRIFLKPLEKIKISLKSDTNNGKVTWISMRVYDNIWLIYSLNDACSRRKL
jgi:hypothetical protein